MAVKHIPLSLNERAMTGFTDLYTMKYTDLTESTDNTAQALTLETLAAGDIVMQNVVVEVQKAWNGHAELTATVSVGVAGGGAAATALTPTLTICTAGTGAAITSAETSDCQTNAHYVSAGIAMLATFTPDADSALDEFTSGELRIWANISRKADRSNAA